MVAAFCLLWASAFSVAKLAFLDAPPLLVLTIRFLLAGGSMLALAAACGMSLRLSPRDLVLYAVLGLANQAAFLGIGYLGLRTTSSGLTALVMSANPVLTAVLATFFLGERMTVRKAVGLALGLGGVAWVVAGRLASGADHVAGIVFIVIALVAMVVGTVLFKKLAPAGGLWIGNAVQNLTAGLAVLPFAVAFERVGDIAPSWRLAASTAYLGLVVSVFAYVLWFHLLKVSGATAASAYHFLMPPLGTLFGWLLLGEAVAVADLAGILPVAFGIYLVTRPASPPRTPRRHAPAGLHILEYAASRRPGG
jgi:drug/metabolite transporter (DMT)-like permease